MYKAAYLLKANTDAVIVLITENKAAEKKYEN